MRNDNLLEVVAGSVKKPPASEVALSWEYSFAALAKSILPAKTSFLRLSK